MTRENFKKGMLILGEAFSDRFAELDKASMKIWFELLNDIPDDLWSMAILFIARNHEKPPTPGTIRKIAFSEGKSLSGEEAWAQVTKQVREQGQYGIPEFDDEALQMSVEAIGWQHICESGRDQVAAIRAHFYRTYGAMQNRVQMDKELAMIEANVLKLLQ